MHLMAYQVLARKYRPQQFADVIAQEHVTRTLRNALTHERVGSAYLFCGPRGTGKTTCARILAKAINCLSGPRPEPCETCASCREITGGNSLDVLEVDAASNTGVDDIRSLRENIRYLPTTGKKRIYIIDEVHRLSGSAFDALLKTLEEPPAHVVFMFATTDPLKLPETILSRTQRFDFRRVTIDHLADHLHQLALREGITISRDALRLIARKGDGSVRDSLSLLDQIIAFGGETIEAEDVVASLGLVDRQLLLTFLQQAIANDTAGILRTVVAATDGGLETTEFLAELQEELRLLLLLKTDASLGDSLALSSTEVSERMAMIADLQIGDLLRIIQITTSAHAESKTNLDARLVLEVAAVRISTLARTVDLAALVHALESGESINRPETSHAAVRTTAPVSSGPPNPPAAAGQVQAGQTASGRVESKPESPKTEAAQLSMGRLKAGWSDFLIAVRKLHPMLATQLELGSPSEIRGHHVVIRFGLSGKTASSYVLKADSAAVLSKAAQEVYHLSLTILAEVDESSIEPEVEDRPRSDDLLAASPRLRKLVEKVNGEIIGVKRVE